MDRKDRLEALRTHLAAAGSMVVPKASLRAGIATGLEAIDERLPRGRLAAGTIHGIAGKSAYGFVAFLLNRLGGPVLWCRHESELSQLYPVGLFDHGIDPSALILVDCPGRKELLRSAEEGLRCPPLAAVIAETGRGIDLTASRRLQLAAQAGGATGFLLFMDGIDMQGPVSLSTAWDIEPAPAVGSAAGIVAWHVRLNRCRNGRSGEWMVSWNGQTHRLDLVPPAVDRPADSPPRQRLAG